MSGMEGRYFVSRDAWAETEDEWDQLYYDNYYGRKVVRPNTIDLSSTQLRAETHFPPSSQDDEEVVKYVRLVLGLAARITEHVLSHPFVVLRRQCQVNHNARRFHIVPITLFPVVVHLHQQQGITTLWKGVGSVLFIRGLSIGVEDLLSKLTPLPKEVSWNATSLKVLGQHFFLKCISLAVITPFYSASLVETVQSDVASIKPGVFDVFKEGLRRIFCWSYPKKGRMLPVWTLVIPTVMYGLTRYLFHSSVKSITYDMLYIRQKQELESQGALPKDWSNQNIQDIEVTAQLVSLIASDIVFYPLETILHRLHLQGTRTIIDNLDSGLSVTPILTNYEGTLDCYQSTVRQEGFAGLYKGFGALLLQFTAYTAVIKLTKFVLIQVSNLLRQSSPPQNMGQPTPLEQSAGQKSQLPTPSQASTPQAMTPSQHRNFPEQYSQYR